MRTAIITIDGREWEIKFFEDTELIEQLCNILTFMKFMKNQALKGDKKDAED